MHRVMSCLAAVLLLLGAAPYASASPNKVFVEVYAEGLCPYCMQLVREQIADLWKNGLAAITEIEYIPSGNAKMADDGTVTCQHGPKECEMNRAIACATSLAPLQDDWFPFLLCLEAKADEVDDDSRLDVPAAAHACATRGGIQPARLATCYNGTMGDFLVRRAYERTASLKPPHQWVPWVVVNSVPLFDDFENLHTFICAAYTGYPKPKYCFRPPPPDPTPSAGAARAAKVSRAAPAAPFASVVRAMASKAAGRARHWLLGAEGRGMRQ